MDSDRAGHIAQLVGDIAPLAETQVVNELCPAHTSKRATGKIALLDVQVAP